MNCLPKCTAEKNRQQPERIRFDKRHSILLVSALAAALLSAGCGSTSTPSTTQTSPPPPTKVVVAPATATMLRGETLAFTATVSGQTDKSVTWSVASLGSVDSVGRYTAPSDTDGASVVVTATSNAKPSVHGTAAVTLPTIPFSITPAAIALSPGASHTFSATITGLSSSQVNWTVQGTGGGTITNAGLYTAPAYHRDRSFGCYVRGQCKL